MTAGQSLLPAVTALFPEKPEYPEWFRALLGRFPLLFTTKIGGKNSSTKMPGNEPNHSALHGHGVTVANSGPCPQLFPEEKSADDVFFFFNSTH